MLLFLLFLVSPVSSFVNRWTIVRGNVQWSRLAAVIERSVTAGSDFSAEGPPAMEDVVTTREDQRNDGLSALERLGRTLLFYREAIPVLFAYQFLERKIRFEKEVLKKNIDEVEEERQWNNLHDWGSVRINDAITKLKGFYVKTGQIISTRVDIFPEQYTSKLSIMQDALDPLNADEVKSIIQKDLMQGAPLTDLFEWFDDVPLGSASIAQVHKAKLIDGRIVAVKVQRPGIRDKLLGDIGNLINFASAIKSLLPIDYYKVFCELERTLIYELDFHCEAQATQKVAAAVAHSPSNKPRDPPVIVPLPVSGLVSKRVMVLEYVSGTALSSIAKKMEGKSSGEKAATPEEKEYFGKSLLGSLTDAYANMIFGSGIIHGDPHPGNIFITDSNEVALLDCGQVKVLNTEQRIKLAQLICNVNEWEYYNSIDKDSIHTQNLIRVLANSVRSFGVYFKEGTKDECAAAVAILLFGNTGTVLPGGYAGEEISLDSPIVQVVEFPQEFVLLGRATVMIKGIANRLGLQWSLSDKWAPVAREALNGGPNELLPVWSAAEPQVAKIPVVPKPTLGDNTQPIRFRQVWAQLKDVMSFFKKYLLKKTERIAVKYLPDFIRNYLLQFLLKWKNSQENKKKLLVQKTLQTQLETEAN